MKQNIYLVGFMGSGKSTVGKLLAQGLNRTFVDMDAVLEKRIGKPIAEVFATAGEEYFRTREHQLLLSLSRGRRQVVATGGGVPEKKENRWLMRGSGTVVHLQSDLASCIKRLSASETNARPLWKDRSFIEGLYQRRGNLYDESDLSLSVDGRSPGDVAQEIIRHLYRDQAFSTEMGGERSQVRITYTAPTVLGEVIRERRVTLLTDRRVAQLHLERFEPHLKAALAIVVSPGERSKSLDTAQRIYERLLAHRFDRDDLLVALGGGVITDLGAFVASTYKRGMGLCLVSTTLLGCVDAALGGKAAVNLAQAKNSVGSFTVPEAVLLDVTALRTLGRRQISEGLVEAYKTGLVACPELAQLVQREYKPLLSGDLPLLAEVVGLSARTKAEVVAKDFRESGLRRILNLGHTFGHGVEGAHKFKVSHGQAVALGMRVAVELSRSRGLIGDEDADKMQATLRAISPYRIEIPSLDEAWEIMTHDKKIRGGRMIFVLLKAVGEAVCVNDVSRKEVAMVLKVLEAKKDG